MNADNTRIARERAEGAYKATVRLRDKLNLAACTPQDCKIEERVSEACGILAEVCGTLEAMVQMIRGDA